MTDLETVEHDARRARGRRAPPPALPSTRFGEPARAEPGAELDPVEERERSSIGDYLRRQRVLRDVSIEELSALTRIPQRSLERLERGEFDDQPDGFARGFVRTVAQALGLDVDDTVARMLQEPVVGAWERGMTSGRLQRIAVLLALALVVGMGALVLRAGWRLLTGPASGDPASAVVVWRDPVHALAEATGAEVDPAREIDPARGSRAQTPPRAPRETRSPREAPRP